MKSPSPELKIILTSPDNCTSILDPLELNEEELNELKSPEQAALNAHFEQGRYVPDITNQNAWTLAQIALACETLKNQKRDEEVLPFLAHMENVLTNRNHDTADVLLNWHKHEYSTTYESLKDMAISFLEEQGEGLPKTVIPHVNWDEFCKKEMDNVTYYELQDGRVAVYN